MEYVFTLAYERLFAQKSPFARMLHPAKAIANMHAFISKSMAMHAQWPTLTSLALQGPMAEDGASYLDLAELDPLSTTAKRSTRLLLNPDHYELTDPATLQVTTEIKLSTMENLCKLMEEHYAPALRPQQGCVWNGRMQQQVASFSKKTVALNESRRVRQGI
jgi:hypothetical protein